MSNFIYYEKLEDYEEQVKKAKECDEKDKEIERLNNIINELEKWLDKNVSFIVREDTKPSYETLEERIDKAIEYIKEQTVDVEMNIYGIPPTIKSFRGNTERLLEILKGEDKE